MSTLTSLSPYPIPAEDEALRAPVRAFLKEALRDVPAHIRARSWSGYDPAFSCQLGERGWLGITLPKSLGGGGRSAFARYVLVEEFLNAGAPVGSHWIADRQSGPLILKYGTPEQQQFYIPRICRGEAFFCIGMSEPNSGSDLAGVKTRATRTDKGWLLNGQKIWTSTAKEADMIFCLVRTEGDAAKHQGISYLIFPMTTPGIEVRPLRTMTGHAEFNETFFTDARCPADSLIGAVGDGWRVAMGLLAFERGVSTLGQQMGFRNELDEVIAAANECGIAMVFTGERHFKH